MRETVARAVRAAKVARVAWAVKDLMPTREAGSLVQVGDTEKTAVQVIQAARAAKVARAVHPALQAILRFLYTATHPFLLFQALPARAVKAVEAARVDWAAEADPATPFKREADVRSPV